MTTQPDGWGFCPDRSCPCWQDDPVPCRSWIEDEPPHPFGRCARCGWLEAAHTGAPGRV